MCVNLCFPPICCVACGLYVACFESDDLAVTHCCHGDGGSRRRTQHQQQHQQQHASHASTPEQSNTYHRSAVYVSMHCACKRRQHSMQDTTVRESTAHLSGLRIEKLLKSHSEPSTQPLNTAGHRTNREVKCWLQTHSLSKGLPTAGLLASWLL